MRFEDLTIDSVILIFINLSYQDIQKLCISSDYVKQNICQNDDFWQQKYIHDFGLPDQVPLIWEEAYHQIANQRVIGIGDGSIFKLETEEGIFSIPVPYPKLFSINDNSLIISDVYGNLHVAGQNTENRFGHRVPREIGGIKRLNFKIPNLINISIGYNYTLFTDRTGNVFGIGNIPAIGEFYDQPVELPINNIKLARPGVNHINFVTNDGELYVLGSSEYALGLGDQTQVLKPTKIQVPPVEDVNIFPNSTMLLTTDGEIYIYGKEFQWKIPDVFQIDKKFKAISHKYDHSLLVTESGDVLSYGSNEYGELGRDFSINYDTSIHHVPNLPKIKAVAAGYRTSLFLSETNKVFGFGKMSNMLNTYLSKKPKKLPVNNIKSMEAGDNAALLLYSPMALYSTIEKLINRKLVIDHRIFENAYGKNVIYEVTDKLGHTHQTTVYYDVVNNVIYPPK